MITTYSSVVLELLAFVVMTLICMVYGVGLTWIVHRLVGHRATEMMRELATGVGLRISVLYSLIIGILVAGLVDDYTDSMERVFAEGVEVVRINQTLGLLDSEPARAAQLALRAYVDSAVHDEWGQLGTRSPNSETRRLLDQLEQATSALRPDNNEIGDIEARARASVARLSEYRVHRFLASTTHGMYMFWLLGIVGFTALLVQFGFYPASRTGSIIIGVFCVMQATVFFIALVASDPFSEPGAISSMPLQRSIELIRVEPSPQPRESGTRKG